MAENTGQERTEEATEKRKADTRKKGQVPRSKELETLASLFAAGFGMLIFGEGIVADINSIMIGNLSFGSEEAFSESVIIAQMSSAGSAFLQLLLPLLVLLCGIVLLSPLALGGWIFSFSQLLPKAERISPIKGFGRIFSSRSVMELLKALSKFGLVAALTIYVLNQALDDLYMLSLQPLVAAFSAAGSLFVWSFLAFSSALILVVALDIPYQVWSFKKQIMMTKQEVKDESKETDGRPEIKSAVRERQQEMSRRRMMAEVPEADVVITNPTHYAVALRYEQDGTGAPRVVAKGQDQVAGKIREVAREHGVTVFSAPPLARALYASTELNQEIPANLFMAVAQVLAYVFQLKQATAGLCMMPSKPVDLPVPEEYSDSLATGGNF